MSEWKKAMNHPLEAFTRGNSRVGWSLVGLTILIDSIVYSAIDYFSGNSLKSISVMENLVLMGLGIVTYVAICSAFWGVCKAMGSRLSWKKHLKAWGITYMPTLLCAILLVLTEKYFYLFIGNVILGMLINIAFIGILLWKTFLYGIYLSEFAGLKKLKFWGAFSIMGIIILALAWMDAWLGLRTPIL